MAINDATVCSPMTMETNYAAQMMDGFSGVLSGAKNIASNTMDYMINNVAVPIVRRAVRAEPYPFCRPIVAISATTLLMSGLRDCYNYRSLEISPASDRAPDETPGSNNDVDHRLQTGILKTVAGAIILGLCLKNGDVHIAFEL